MKIYFDGSGWNGKTSSYAVVFEGHVRPHALVHYETEKTNNEMEYLGAIAAAVIANNDDVLVTDSQLVEGHVNKGWKINFPHLKTLYNQLVAIMNDKKLTIVWVPRKDNLAGKVFE